MPDLKRKQLASCHPPSQLRNEYIAPPSVNERIIQVPDSQAVIPETQYDLLPKDLPDNVEHDHIWMNTQGPERSDTTDEAFVSSHRVSKKDIAGVDLTFGAKQLERPKVTEGPQFSPFSKPNAVAKSDLEEALESIPHGTAKAAREESPVLQSIDSPLVDGTPSNNAKGNEQIAVLSDVHPDHELDHDNQVVQGSPTSAEENIDVPFSVASTSVISGVPAREAISDQYPAQHDHQADASSMNRRPNGKKAKKGRKSKPRRPDNAAATTATHVAQSPKLRYTLDHSSTALATRDQGYAGLYENEALVSTYGQRTVELHQTQQFGGIPTGQQDNAHNDKISQLQDVSTAKLPMKDLQTAPSPTTTDNINIPGSFESRKSSYLQDVSPVYGINSATDSKHNDTRYCENGHAVVQKHYGPTIGSVIHESHGRESPQTALRDPENNLDTHLNPHEPHDTTIYAQDLSRPEHAVITPSEALPNAGDANVRSSHFQIHDSILHETSSHDNSNRINKPWKKRAKGSSVLPDQRVFRQGVASFASPEHEGILSMMAMCLRAGDTKAHNIVDTCSKAHEAAIASLQETIGQQNKLIQNLQAQNDGLQCKAEKASESTTRLQKYVKGMEGDYSRLKNKTETHQKTCDKTVRDCIHDFEQEKSVLKNDFLMTIDALTNSQRHMRAAMNDCLNQLMLSEQNHQAVNRQLQKMNVGYEEEKRKRSDLEQQILPAVQAIQTSLGDKHTVILEKLGDVQGSLDDTSAEQERASLTREFSDINRSLRAIPVLTINDVRKAEGMLQSIHESIGSNLSNITRSVEKIQDPTEDIQAYVRKQFCTLRAEVLKYEEALVDCRKAQQSNEHLHQQLEMQEQQCVRLEEIVRSFGQEEADMKARNSLLQSELEVWKEKACNHDMNHSQTDKKAGELEQQLKKVKEDLREELTELGRVQQKLEDQTKELNTIKINLKEKEATYQDIIERLTQEKNGNDNLLRESQTGNTNLALDLRNAERKIREMASEAKKLRESEMQVRDELKKAHIVATEASSLVSNVEDLKKQLTKKSEEAQSANDVATSLSSQVASLKQQVAQVLEARRSGEEDLKNTQVEHTRLIRKAADLAREKDQLKDQLEEHLITISSLKEKVHSANRMQETSTVSLKQLQSVADTMKMEKDQLMLQMSVDRSKCSTLKKELDARDRTHRQDVDKLKELQLRIDHLQDEKLELEVKLGQSRAIETKLSEAQAMYSSEKEGLQHELAKLQAALEEKSQELHHAATDAMEISNTTANDHASEIDELKHRIGQAEMALKTANKMIEHKSRELEAHKKATLEKYEMLVLETQRQENMRGLKMPGKYSNGMLAQNTHPQVTASMQVAGSETPSSHLVTDIGESNNNSVDSRAKAKKKPTRHNTTVLNVAEDSHSQPAQLMQLSDTADERHHEQKDGDDQITAPTTDELDEHELVFLDPVAEGSHESQRTLVCSVGAFDNSMKSMSNNRAVYTSSSALSDPPSSDDLIDMDPLEKGTLHGDIGNNTRSSELAQVLRDHAYRETPRRPSLYGASSVHEDRPKSQANTGSRMLPPRTPTASTTKDIRTPINLVRRVPSKSTRSGRVVASINIRSSSPDYIHRPVSSLKTYRTHVKTSSSLADDAPSEMHRPRLHSPKMKRKGPESRAPENVPSKRHRFTPQMSSSQSVLSSQPVQTSQPQSQGLFVVPTPRIRRFKGGIRDEEFAAMFERELQTESSHQLR